MGTGSGRDMMVGCNAPVGVVEGVIDEELLEVRERNEALPERKCLEEVMDGMEAKKDQFIEGLLSHVLTSPCVAPLACWNYPH